jgi:ABC-type dipeptide/oligopeptide/nickel transport system permease subunit
VQEFKNTFETVQPLLVQATVDVGTVILAMGELAFWKMLDDR